MSYTDKRKQIDELKAEIEAFGLLSSDIKKKIDYKFRLDWNYYSNSMEGNTLTMAETRSVMVGNLTVGGKPLKDVLEIKGHDEIIKDILNIGKGDVRLSEARIREIHNGIMYEDDQAKSAMIGVWKQEANYLLNYKGERIDFALPAEIPALMHDLLNRTNAAIDAIKQNKSNAPHPIDVALQFHLDYVTIHPFYDGNGRTARILTNLLLISFGYPPFWIKTEERTMYSQYIADVQAYGGPPNLFYDFAAGLILRSQQLMLEAIEGKSIEELDDLVKRVSMINNMIVGADKEIQMIRNNEVLSHVLEKLVKPLFEIVFDKINIAASLFISVEFEYVINGLSTITYKNINTLMDNLKKSWEDKGGNIFEIKLVTRLDKFKKLGINAFDLVEVIYISLEDYKYKMILPEGKIIERLYHQLLSPQEIEELATKFVNYILDKIEEQVKLHSK